MIRVLINGINGKMGQILLSEISNCNNLEVVAGVDIDSDNSNIPIYNDTSLIKEDVDVIIDFSIPSATMNILEYANNKKIPVVIATTGFSDMELDKIKNYSKNIPIFHSSNMSFEINLMCDIVSKLALKLNSDIEIVETHHRNKVDSPSGTALMIADSINEALDNKMDYMYDRHSVREKRSDNEIGIHSIRGGTEVGKHTVMFLGDNESFEISHTVTSRSVFAKGAIKAAEFIVKQENGLYNMKDLIN